MNRHLILLLLLALVGCAHRPDDPFGVAQPVYRPIEKSRIHRIEFTLGKESLLHYRGIEYLPARIAVTDDQLISEIVAKLKPEEEKKFHAFCNSPLGSYSSLVDFMDENGRSLGVIFIYPEDMDSEFNLFIAELTEAAGKNYRK